MNNFIERIRRHAEHVSNVGNLCNTEETTKQALILPFFDILGFYPFDPMRVKAEYRSEFPGAKANERVDYALFCNGTPVMFIEAKAFNENLTNHAHQLAKYFNATPEVTVAVITNGREWRFFTDLENKNVMDKEPFLIVNLSEIDETAITRLYNFRHDEFKPDALRTLAEYSVYLNSFTQVISNVLREPNAEFAKFVANQANIQKQYNARFLDSMLPIIRQAIGRAVSDMVVTGLTTKAPVNEIESEQKQQLTSKQDDKADIVDPINPKIITTYSERRLFEITKQIISEQGGDLVAKDTETYYSILYKGKANRWLLRYYGDKKTPTVVFCVDLNKDRKHEIERAGLSIGTGNAITLISPEDILRISGIVFDALEFCKNDENFKFKKHNIDKNSQD